MRLRVEVQSASGHSELPGAPRVECWAQAAAAAALQAHGVLSCEEAELTLRTVDMEEGVALNAAYRGGDDATNVLSFPFEAREHTDPPLLGDVVVCVPVIEREAREQGKPLEAHFAHMVIHGVLHLFGYEHENETDAATMEGAERSALASVGFGDPYAERGDGGS